MNAPRIEFPGPALTVGPTPDDGTPMETATQPVGHHAFAALVPVSLPVEGEAPAPSETPIDTGPSEETETESDVLMTPTLLTAICSVSCPQPLEHAPVTNTRVPDHGAGGATIPVTPESAPHQGVVVAAPVESRVAQASAPSTPPPPPATQTMPVAVPRTSLPPTDETLPGPKAAAAPPSDGTASAKEVAVMKTAVPTEELTVAKEQELPVRQRLPMAQPVESVAPLAHRPVGRALINAHKGSEPAMSAVPVALAEPVRMESVAEPVGQTVRTTGVARVAETVWEQVVTFRRIGATEAEVRVQPDRHTELRLELRWQAGEVQVTARLERGDFETLHRHWGTLQETLSAQGVRLSALQSGSGSDSLSAHGDSGRGGRDGGWPTREERARGEPVVWDEPMGVPSRSRSDNRSMPGRGWERWA